MNRSHEEPLRLILLEYRAILDNVPLGIAFTCEQVILRHNDHFSEMFGWDAGELAGRLTSEIHVSGEADRDFSVKAGQTLRDGGRLDTEMLMKRRDGSVFWCRMMAKLVDPQNPQHGAILIIKDITERRDLRESLQGAMAELELRVRERTAELASTNARLEKEITDRRAIEEQVRHLADHDVLTNLPNRRLLDDRLARAMTAAKRNAEQVAVFFIDLDHFKQINDKLGHRVGDLLLQSVAQRLCQVLREIDTVSRVGGDEFILVLPDLHVRTGVVEIARRVLKALTRSYAIDGHTLTVTASIGISLYPDDGTNADNLISYADMAMYHAKQRGRNNFQFYDRILTPLQGHIP